MQKQTTKVKGLLIDLSRKYGGASTRAISIAKRLQEWDVAIAALEGSPVSRVAGSQGIPIVTVGKSQIDPRIPFRLATIIRQHRFQLVDTQNIQSKVWGSMAARLSHAVLVSTLNSTYITEQGKSIKGYLYSLLDMLTNSQVACYIAVSESIRNWLREEGVPEDRIELIHNGIETLNGSAVITNGQLRHTLGLPEDAFICAAVGRLVWAKGFDDLIEAFNRVVERIPQAYCLIIGDGASRLSLEKQINQAGLEKQVILVGQLEPAKVAEILRASDIFVMPSRSEGIPYALLEAGALGLPILATRCGGIPEVVRDGIEAILVQPGDTEAIANAIELLFKDPQTAGHLGTQVKQRIRQDFSIEKQILATKQAYMKAVRGS